MANIRKYKDNTVKVTYSVPPSVAKRIEEEATAAHISKSEVVSKILLNHYQLNAYYTGGANLSVIEER